MDKFKIFNLLPNGVIVFHDEKVEYLNQHMLDVLNINFLKKQNAIGILLKTLNIKNEKLLFEFFTTHEYFIHNIKTIQIAHVRHGSYDIFSFIRITPILLSTSQDKKPFHKKPKSNIDTKVAKFLKIHNIKKVMILTFYKGLPLKNYGDIIELNDNFIKIAVDQKHQISLSKRDDILLITNTKKGSSILHGHVIEHKENLFKIKDFTLSKEDMHLRDGIRIKTYKDMSIRTHEKSLDVYDISENGISISIDDTVEENFLKKKAAFKLIYNNEVLNIDVKYIKTIYDEDDKVLKMAFKMFPTNESAIKIHNYINKKQNGILQEIHRYQSNLNN